MWLCVWLQSRMLLFFFLVRSSWPWTSGPSCLVSVRSRLHGSPMLCHELCVPVCVNPVSMYACTGTLLFRNCCLLKWDSWSPEALGVGKAGSSLRSSSALDISHKLVICCISENFDHQVATFQGKPSLRHFNSIQPSQTGNAGKNTLVFFFYWG